MSQSGPRLSILHPSCCAAEPSSSTFRLSGEQAQFQAIIAPAANTAQHNMAGRHPRLGNGLIPTAFARTALVVQLDDVNEERADLVTVTDAAGLQQRLHSRPE